MLENVSQELNSNDMAKSLDENVEVVLKMENLVWGQLLILSSFPKVFTINSFCWENGRGGEFYYNFTLHALVTQRMSEKLGNLLFYLVDFL